MKNRDLVMIFLLPKKFTNLRITYNISAQLDIICCKVDTTFKFDLYYSCQVDVGERFTVLKGSSAGEKLFQLTLFSQ